MTLIIGFVCDEGIGLVSDTKISNTDTPDPVYQSKILTPLEDTPFIVGAAGYTDLFFEFNRKIRDSVAQRIRQYKIANIEQLIRTGLERDEAIKIVDKLQKTISNNQQALVEKPESNKEEVKSDVELPFEYSSENFLDDCKSLIRTISDNSGLLNPIELLIGIRSRPRHFPNLYKIDSRGREEAVSEYTAIGTGSPFVRVFFSELYDPTKSFAELAKAAIRTITFVQEIAKEVSVGFSNTKPPEVVVIDAYSHGKITYPNLSEVVTSATEDMAEFTKIIKKNSVIDLQD